MNKNFFIVLFVVMTLFAAARGNSLNPKPVPKPKQQPSNCIKQPEIVRRSPVPAKPEPKLYYPSKPAPLAKTYTEKNNDNSIPHFSIFNFFNSFYTKDTLDRLQVM